MVRLLRLSVFATGVDFEVLRCSGRWRTGEQRVSVLNEAGQGHQFGTAVVVILSIGLFAEYREEDQRKKGVGEESDNQRGKRRIVAWTGTVEDGVKLIMPEV